MTLFNTLVYLFTTFFGLVFIFWNYNPEGKLFNTTFLAIIENFKKISHVCNSKIKTLISLYLQETKNKYLVCIGIVGMRPAPGLHWHAILQ